jgi:hypothetical protein
MEDLDPGHWTDHLLPPLRAVDMLPRVVLSDAETVCIQSGQAIRLQLPQENAEEVAAVRADGRLAAILVARGPGQWGPACNLPLQERC